VFSDAKDFALSKFFGTGRTAYSFVDEVLMIHMTLITSSLYTIGSDDFRKSSKEKPLFFEFILKSIEPELSPMRY
jgi:hypothetical protein